MSQNKGKEVHQLIQDHVKNFRKLFTDIKEGKLDSINFLDIEDKYKLKRADIPDELRKYIENKRRDAANIEKKASDHIDEMIKKTEHMLKAYEKEKKYTFKPGSQRKQPKFKPGHMASRLAEDMLFFQPSRRDDGSDKMTSYNYQCLQSSLAFYGLKKDSLKAMFKAAGLLQDIPVNPHPFLHDVMTEFSPNIGDFFKKYFEKKIEYLKSCKEKNFEELHFLRFLKKRKNKQKQDDATYFSKAAETYLKMPINLPRGLFASLIEETIKEKHPQKFEELKRQRPRCNSSFLLLKFLEWENDAIQGFYQYERDKRNKDYKKLFELIDDPDWQNDTVGKIKKALKGKSDEKLAGLLREFEKNEKRIRLQKIQDIVLFYIAKNVFNIPNLEGGMKLQGIHDQEKTILNREVDHSFKDTFKCDKIKMSAEFTIRGRMKIKNYGNFRSLIHDKRLASFLFMRQSNFCGDPNKYIVDYNDVEKEFEIYDKRRKDFFEALHAFEEKAIKSCQIQRNKYGFIDFQEILKGLKDNKKSSYTPDELKRLDELIPLRNSFCHHDYPVSGACVSELDRTKQLTNQIIDKVIKFIEDETQKIDQNSVQTKEK